MSDEEQKYIDVDEKLWSTIKNLGLAAQFSAANVLKYIRQNNTEKAKWYYSKLVKLGDEEVMANIILIKMSHELTPEERALVS